MSQIRSNASTRYAIAYALSDYTDSQKAVDCCIARSTYYDLPWNMIHGCYGRQCNQGVPVYSAAPPVDPSVYQSFVSKKLVSNIPLVSPNQGVPLEVRRDQEQERLLLTKPLNLTPTVIDPNLLDCWGMVVANDSLWVANSGTGKITSYNLVGAILPMIVNVYGPHRGIAQPTGIAQNMSFDPFIINNGPIEGTASLLICTQDGTIHGYNSSVNIVDSIMIYNGSTTNDVYTGIAVANVYLNRTFPFREGSRRFNYLYVADFFNQRVLSFDGEMRQMDFHFVDEDSNEPIGEEYAPYNIAYINEQIYVTYAKQNPRRNQFAIGGRGEGFVSVFTPEGVFVRRFASRGTLNAPWGICPAPSVFGYPAGSIMVGNQGDGVINVFDLQGRWLNFIGESFMVPICFNGLRAIVPAPNGQSVYWAATDNNLLTAMVGSLFSRTAYYSQTAF